MYFLRDNSRVLSTVPIPGPYFLVQGRLDPWKGTYREGPSDVPKTLHPKKMQGTVYVINLDNRHSSRTFLLFRRRRTLENPLRSDEQSTSRTTTQTKKINILRSPRREDSPSGHFTTFLSHTQTVPEDLSVHNGRTQKFTTGTSLSLGRPPGVVSDTTLVEVRIPSTWVSVNSPVNEGKSPLGTGVEDSRPS